MCREDEHAYDAAAVSVGGSPWSRPRSGRPHLFGDLLVLPDGRDLLLQTSGSVTLDSGGGSFEVQTPWEGYEDRECGDPFPLAAALAGEDGDLLVLFGLEGRLIVTPTAALPRTDWSEVASASLVQDPYQTYSDMCCSGDRCAVVDPALGVAWADVRSPGTGWRRLYAPSILPSGWSSVESMAVSGGDLWVRTGPTLGSISPTGVYRAVVGASPRGGGGSAGRLSCSFGFPHPLVPAGPGLVGLSVFDVVALGEDGVEVLAEIDPGLRGALGFGSPELDVVGRDILVFVLSGAAATYPLSTWRGEFGWRTASAGGLSDYNFASELHPPDTIACGSDGRCFAAAWGPRTAIEAEDWASVRSVLLESPEGGPLDSPWTPVSGVEGVAGVRALREGEPVGMGPCSIWLGEAGGGWKETDVRGGPCAELPPWSTCLPPAEDGDVVEACRTAEWPEMTWAVACGTRVVVRFLRDSGFWVVEPDAGDTSASMSLPRIEDVDEMGSWAGGIAVLSAGTLLWYSCERI